MSSVFEKLNLKQQQEILVVDAPSSFEPELRALKGVVGLRVRQVAIDEDWSALCFRRVEYIKSHSP